LIAQQPTGLNKMRLPLIGLKTADAHNFKAPGLIKFLVTRLGIKVRLDATMHNLGFGFDPRAKGASQEFAVVMGDGHNKVSLFQLRR
jgi:hypothetical protein